MYAAGSDGTSALDGQYADVPVEGMTSGYADVPGGGYAAAAADYASTVDYASSSTAQAPGAGQVSAGYMDVSGGYGEESEEDV